MDFGKNEYIETNKDIVLSIAAGPGSRKDVYGVSLYTKTASPKVHVVSCILDFDELSQ